MGRRFIAPLAIATLVLAGYVRAHAATGQVIYPSTGWLFLIALAGACILLVEAIFAIIRPSRATVARLRLLTVTTLAMLFVAEATFRYATHRWDTYLEVNGLPYVSPYIGEPTWFHAGFPNSRSHVVKPEFTIDRTLNSLGFADREFVVDKAPGEYRILALGDSFTEGVGTSAETTWVKVMERRLADRYPDSHISTYNAGVSGSDPYFELKLLTDKLSVYRPDLVIVEINTSDVQDIVLRGGDERFRPDGRTKYKTPPWWERVYALSYISRAILQGALGYNFTLVRDSDMPELNREATQLIGAAVESMRDYCRTHGMRLLIVSHPSRFETEQQRYDTPWYDGLMERFTNERDLRFVDLLQYYGRSGLITKDNAAKYFWPVDLHHNTEGYRIMGESVATTVISMDLGPGPESREVAAAVADKR